MKLALRTPQARRWQADSVAARPRSGGVDHLMQRRHGHAHWAHEYAARVLEQTPPGRPALIQTSMSPSGRFHIGNFRDTVTAHLVHRAVLAAGGSSRVLLSFDDFDPVRGRPAEIAAGTAYAPLADIGRPAAALCEDYLRELRAVGISPAVADDQWEIHYQAERYRDGEYLAEQRRFHRDRRRIAGRLGVDRPDELFAPYCQQCGRNTTTMLAATRGTVRYRCGTCGAHVHTTDLREVKPVWALDWALRVVHEGIDCEPAGHDHCSAGSTMDRTQPLFRHYLKRPQPVIVPYGLVRQGVDRGKVSGSRGGGLCLRDLLRVLPPDVVLWMYAVPDVRADIRIGLDRPSVLRLYAEFDRFAAAAAGPGRAREIWRLLSDDAPPMPLPGFRRVLGGLGHCLFDVAATVRLLAGDGSAATPSTLRPRVDLALAAAVQWPRPRWLPAVPVDPEPRVRDHVVRVFEADGPGAALDRAGYRAAYAMLFGGSDGPSVRGLVDRLGAAAVLDAVRRFAATGERPLRELALARLVEATTRENW